MELSQIYLFHLLHLFQVKTWFQNRRAKWRRLKQVSRLTWTNIFNVNGHDCNKQVYSLFIFKNCQMLRSRILVLVLTDNTLFHTGISNWRETGWICGRQNRKWRRRRFRGKKQMYHGRGRFWYGGQWWWNRCGKRNDGEIRKCVRTEWSVH